MEKVIEVSSLTKEYKGKKAIDNLTFDVYKGEILGLLGPNGSGKSTTINSILALLKYQKGSIKIFGKEMRPDSYDIKQKIGVIFQEVAVLDELNVYDNINYFCGSTATVGSSKNIISGLCAIPQAIFKRRNKPPDNCFGKYFLNSSNPTNSIASSTYLSLVFLSCIYNPQK